MDTTTHNHTSQEAASTPTIDELRAASKRAFDAMNEARDNCRALTLVLLGRLVRERYPDAAEVIIYEPRGYRDLGIGVFDASGSRLNDGEEYEHEHVSELAARLAALHELSHGRLSVPVVG